MISHSLIYIWTRCLPVFCIAELRLGEVDDLLVGPAGCLVATEEQLEFEGLEAPERVHGEDGIEAVLECLQLPANAVVEHELADQADVLVDVVAGDGHVLAVRAQTVRAVAEMVRRRVVLEGQAEKTGESLKSWLKLRLVYSHRSMKIKEFQ